MKTNEQENTTVGSLKIPVRRSTGVAGPSREVPGRDASASGTNKAGQENNNAGNSDTTKKITHKAPRLVERKTGLRGQGIGASRESKSAIRKRTEQDIYCSDPEVAYVRAEEANRDLVCTLMERQDRMNEAIFLKMIDPGYRMEDLEEWKETEPEKRE
ncbi:MAG: hypothetical protein Q8N94_08990 [Methanoregula sp.]|nr:hypothetical protein [Methanoregula sp.]